MLVQPITAKVGGAENQDTQSAASQQPSPSYLTTTSWGAIHKTVSLHSSCLDPLSSWISCFPSEKPSRHHILAGHFNCFPNTPHTLWLPVPRLLLVFSPASLLKTLHHPSQGFLLPSLLLQESGCLYHSLHSPSLNAGLVGRVWESMCQTWSAGSCMFSKNLLCDKFIVW